MPLIIGLGNPGRKYAGSRHNIGFEVIDKLADSFSVSFSAGKGSYYIAKVKYRGQSLLLIKPSTYMNNSGTAVREALQWFKLEPQDCLICYDDLNLDVGALRLRPSGSAGGHNGIQDIINKLGTRNFPRLRVGIGDNFREGQQIQHVLSSFTKRDRESIDVAIERATDAILKVTQKGIEQAMNDFN